MGLLKRMLELIFSSKKDNPEENEYTEDFIYHHIDSDTDADDYALHTTGDNGEA